MTYADARAAEILEAGAGGPIAFPPGVIKAAGDIVRQILRDAEAEVRPHVRRGAVTAGLDKAADRIRALAEREVTP